jgi:hypothetical protein
MSVHITSTKHAGEGSGSGDPATSFALRDTLPGETDKAPLEPEEARLTAPSVAFVDRRCGPFVIELHVELSAMDDVPDRAGLVLEVVAESLRAQGWNPGVVVCAQPPPGAHMGGVGKRRLALGRS